MNKKVISDAHINCKHILDRNVNYTLFCDIMTKTDTLYDLIILIDAGFRYDYKIA